MRGHIIIAVVCGFAAAAWVANETMAQQEGSERAYTPPRMSMSKDEAVALILNKKEKGIVIINVTVNPLQCDAIGLVLSWSVDGKLNKTTFRWGKLSSYGGMKELAPAEYTVFSVGCGYGAFQNQGTAFRGPFAAFRVAAGELVDADVLALRVQLKTDGIFQRSGTLHKTVERSGPDADKKLKADLPRSFARIIRRPMTIVGPADVGVQQNLF